jgi:hypothetical protein
MPKLEFPDAAADFLAIGSGLVFLIQSVVLTFL